MLEGNGRMSAKDNPISDKKHFKINRDVIIEPEMFYSEAFKTLSASALRTLMRCLQKRKWEYRRLPGAKARSRVYLDDGFIFPYTEAAFLGIGTTQFWKNMRTLVELGFIDVHYQGGWYQRNEKERDYSIYRISDRWKLYGTASFKHVPKAQVLSPEYFIRKNLEKKDLRATSQKRSRPLHESEVDGGKRGNPRLHESEVDRKKHVTRKGLKTVATRGES